MPDRPDRNAIDYDSNDTALAKARQGSSGFDIVVPSQTFVPVWIK